MARLVFLGPKFDDMGFFLCNPNGFGLVFQKRPSMASLGVIGKSLLKMSHLESSLYATSESVVDKTRYEYYVRMYALCASIFWPD